MVELGKGRDDGQRALPTGLRRLRHWLSKVEKGSALGGPPLVTWSPSLSWMFPTPNTHISLPLPLPQGVGASKVWKVGWVPTHCLGVEDAVLPGGGALPSWHVHFSYVPELPLGRGVLGHTRSPQNGQQGMWWPCQGISLGLVLLQG